MSEPTDYLIHLADGAVVVTAYSIDDAAEQFRVHGHSAASVCVNTSSHRCGHPVFVERNGQAVLAHRLARTDDLTFAALRAANKRRLPQFKNKHGEPAHSQSDGSDWSISDWLMAVTGELGELANLRKKVLRGDLTHGQAQQETADELADVATYLDILAFRLGVDLGAAVASKFNRVSIRVGCDVRLPEVDA
jgi:NTP pyrophosphatase (non-canonical NTP hydrolase)